MRTVNVDLGERSYPIHIGEKLLGEEALLAEGIRANQVMVVTNETIAPLYLDALLSALRSFQVETVILPDGERYKT